MTDEPDPDLRDQRPLTYLFILKTEPNAVHLAMLRGSIAKLTPAHIGHLYRGQEATEVVAEIYRQNPDQASRTAELEKQLENMTRGRNWFHKESELRGARITELEARCAELGWVAEGPGR